MSRVLAIDAQPTDLSAFARFLLVLLSVLPLLVPCAAHADDIKRLMILRGGAPEVDVSLRDGIDQVLLESVTGRPSFSTVDVSPVPFEDVELAAGCSSRDADCLQRIAGTLDADWLLVRELTRDRDGNVYLTLIAHDGPTARITRRAVAEVAEDARSAPSRVVPLLVDRLYPTLASPEEATPQRASGAPTPELPPLSVTQRERRWSNTTVAGASTLGAGAVAMTAGITLWALSQRDARDYHAMKIVSTDDADRAIELHDRAELRASVGRGLVIGGTLAAVAGAVTLLWTPLRAREPRAMDLRLTPTRAGLGVGLGGAWRGGL
ncbi:MAG: hypothetical protein ABW252_20400 [Polyangiales bacterium]